jgi:AcrR family transcriptional regulator
MAGGRPDAPVRRRDAEVLAAAGEVFAARGYSRATVQDVADVLGILKGSLYHYIDSKEDLLYAVLGALHDHLDEILAEVAAHDELGPLERLELYVRRQVVYHVENLASVTAYYHDVDRLSATHRDAILARRRPHTDYVTALIRDGQTAGEIPWRRDPRILANCVFATIIWVYRWYQPSGALSGDELAQVCVDFALGGIMGDEPARPAAS